MICSSTSRDRFTITTSLLRSDPILAMNRFSWVVGSSILTRVWVALCAVVFVPIYLKYLGVEGYGLIGFCNILLSVAGIFDLGLGGALTHELAQLRAESGNQQKQRNTVRTLEVFFWFIALLIGTIVFLGANFISERWLNASKLPTTELVSAIQMMGITVAFQFVSGFYQGGLVGVERQVLTNIILALSTTCKSGGAVLILWLIPFSPKLYFGWQAVVTATTVLVAEAYLWQSVGGAIDSRFDIACLRRMRSFAVGWSANAIVNAGYNNADKLVLSRVLSLETFGYYTIAQTIATALISIGGTIASSAFPRLSRLVAAREDRQLRDFYHQACQLSAVIVMPAACVVGLYSREILLAWTNNDLVAQSATPLLGLMCAGVILFSLTAIPNFLQVAHARFRLMLKFTSSLAIMSTLLSLLLSSLAGSRGAALGWLLVSGAASLIVPFIHRDILIGEFRRWYLNSVLRPLGATLFVCGIARLTIPLENYSLLGLLPLIPICFATAVCGVLVAPDLRNHLLCRIRYRWNPLTRGYRGYD